MHGEIKAVNSKGTKYFELEIQHRVLWGKNNIAQIKYKKYYSRSSAPV